MTNPTTNTPVLQPARLVPRASATTNAQSDGSVLASTSYAIDSNIGFLDRGKVPNIVKDLPDFTGNPRDLSTWILDVEDCLELFSDFQNSYHYHLVLKTIRRKIKNEANDILVSNNTPTNWNEIKEVLRLYYADKRDLMTLDNQLKAMSRKQHESIETYYSRVREMITLISSAIATDETWKGHEPALIKLYNMMALDTFIRGLGEPLSMFCKNYKPNSLAAAYHYCVEFLNLNARSAPFKNHMPIPTPAPRGNIPVPPPRAVMNAPAVPPRYQGHAPPNPPIKPFTPKPSFNTQNVFAPNRTFYPKQPKPEPMEVDRSMQSRMINYGNRPNLKHPRPASDSFPGNKPPEKRMAHHLEGMSEEEYNNYLEEYDVEEYVEPELPIESDLEPEPTQEQESNDSSNLHFLETTQEWVNKW